MKRISRIAPFVLFLTLTAAAPAAVVFVEPVQAGASVGASVLLELRVEDATDLYAFQFDAGFDPMVLSANSVSEGDFLAAGGDTFFIPGTIDNSAGVVSFTGNTLLTAVSGVSGSGVLAILSFTAVGAGTSNVNLFGVTLLDSSLSGIDTTVQNGAVQVVIPEPSMFPAVACAAILLAVSGFGNVRRRQ